MASRAPVGACCACAARARRAPAGRPIRQHSARTSRPALPVAAFPGAGETVPYSKPVEAVELTAPIPASRTPSTRWVDVQTALFPSELLALPTDTGGERFSIPTTFPELPELEVAEYERLVLPNGLKVFLMEDHEVPMIYGSLLMRGGAQADPPNKSGLASVAATVQRNGGTAALPGSTLDLALEDLGASIEVAAGLKTITINFSSLAEDASKTLELVSQLIRDPVLPQSEIDKARASGLNSIAHRYDSASAIPRRKIQELLYGVDSPLARQTSVASLSSISRDDLLTFIATWQRPDTAAVGIVGDFDSAEMKQLLGSIFLEWTPRVDGPPLELPLLEDLVANGEAASRAVGRIYLVDKPGEEEAAVMLAEPGVALEDPDAPALDILGEIMNGFGGRLFDKAGLTYSVSGGWEEPPSYRGLFTVGGNTAKPAALVSAVQEVLEELLETAPSEEEIAQAKQGATNSFVFQFASRAQQLGRILVFDVLGLPPDYVQQYQSQLEEVSAEDLLRATQRHLHPQQQTVVVVGDARRLEAQLKALPGRTLERLPLRPES